MQKQLSKSRVRRSSSRAKTECAEAAAQQSRVRSSLPSFRPSDKRLTDWMLAAQRQGATFKMLHLKAERFPY